MLQSLKRMPVRGHLNNFILINFDQCNIGLNIQEIL
jgi:hypothetical protein